MNILFVCKWNRFRSKVAEAFFNKYNQKKGDKAMSVGVEYDFNNPKMLKSAESILEEKGAKVFDVKSNQLTDYWIKWADKIIIVADDVSSAGFPKDKVERWGIRDASDYTPELVRFGIEEIEKKVKELIEELREG